MFNFDTYVAPTGKNRQPPCAPRSAPYDFSNPVDPSNTYRPNPDSCYGDHFSTGGSVYSPTTPWIPLQQLGVNGNPSTECGYMGNSFRTSTTGWTVSFHKGLENTADSPSAFVMFTRTSVNPDEWTVQANGSCAVHEDVAALHNSDTGELLGYYHLPFKMTLRLK